MSSPEQLSFDLGFGPEEKFVSEPSPAPRVATPNSDYRPSDACLKPLQLKQAILKWLLPQQPTGIGVKVPTRISRFQADVAAFWSIPVKKKLQPQKTAILEFRCRREACWPDCSNRDTLLPQLKAIKDRRLELEAEIRLQEPELRDTDGLFPEYEKWDYLQSQNKDYHHCLKELENLEHSLYRGSRFEQIRRAHVADYLYLVVPEGTVHPHELADGWGLLYVNNALEVSEITIPEPWPCPAAKRIHLVQNIAASTLSPLLFSYGISTDSSGQMFTHPIPRKRRNTNK